MHAAPAIDLSAIRATGMPFWPEGARFAADFRAHRYMKAGAICAPGDAFSVARGTARLARDSAGHWRAFAANIPARTDIGLSISKAGINGIRNSAMAGAAPGMPGVLPTHWIFGGGLAGATYRIVGMGNVQGLPYLDIRIAGMTTAASGVAIRFDTHGIFAAKQGDDVNFSCHIALVDGTMAGFNIVRTCIVEHRADTSTAHTHYPASIRDALGPGMERFSVSRRLAHAETASARADLEMTFGSGQALDMTLRIAVPQLEYGTAASAPIPTSGTVATRDADTLTLHLPAGPHDLELSFADAPPQMIAGVGGNVTLTRNDLDAGLIVSAVATAA